jgi:N utilization substance protein B
MAMQALYQWQLTQASMNQIETEFSVDNDLSKVDIPYFRELVRGVAENSSDLDRMIEPYLDRAVSDVDPIELALVKMGGYELQNRLDVPYRVVINEGVELAKKFGGTDGHRFVNGLLDKLAKKLRYAETRQKR